MSEPTRQEMADLVIYLIGARRHIDGHTPPVKFKLEDFSFSSSRGNNEKKATLIKLLDWLKDDDEISDDRDYRAVKDFSITGDNISISTTTERLLAYLKRRLTKNGSLFCQKKNTRQQMVIGFANRPTEIEIAGLYLLLFASLLKKARRPISYTEIFSALRSVPNTLSEQKLIDCERDPKEKLRFINEKIDYFKPQLDKASGGIFSENNLSIIDNLLTTHESTESGWYRLNY